MKISIGILAHNEADWIGGTLRDLFGQDLFASNGQGMAEIEVICVPNGCSDQTAHVARRVLREVADGLAHPAVTTRVCELVEPGKSNAWNYYVHKFSDRDAECLILMDADIRFGQPRCLRVMIQHLLSHPQGRICVDTPMKQAELQTSRRLRRRLARSISELAQVGPVKIAGSLYCGRAPALRAIWMPQGLLVEDGFLKAMVLTGGFTEPEQFTRILRAPDVYHVFESCRGLRAHLRHERRLMVGSAMNTILFDYLWKNSTPQRDAGALIRDLNERNPNWLMQLVRQGVQRRGWRTVSSKHVLQPCRQLKLLSWSRRLRTVPTALGRALFNLIVFVSATRALHASRIEW